jgi:hypothetical protein
MALVFLAACSSGKPPAVQSVEALVQALVAKDEASYLAHTCPDFEDVALLEYDSFSLVETRLEGLSCQVVEEQGDQAKVVCQGHIIASYGAEDQTIELSERTYQVVNHSGEWLVCGY